MIDISRDGFSTRIMVRVRGKAYGLRWQRHLRRLYLRWGDTTRVLYGVKRHYDINTPAGKARIMAGMTVTKRGETK